MNNEKTKNRRALKVIVISLTVVIVVSLSAVGFTTALMNFISYKYRIYRMVKGNADLLNHSVQCVSYSDAYKIKGIKKISTYNTSDGSIIIDYYCYGIGLVPSTVYYGFYYSGDGKPAGFQGADYELMKEGNGWTWSEKGGDNWYYTEHILDNWYYYKAGF